ncbi:MAG: hypothetical protein JWO90_1018, partial [Solirubrobacterales bacterium]|nr:hypothetical protein [Solirubrobacterales bacterium]
TEPSVTVTTADGGGDRNVAEAQVAAAHAADTQPIDPHTSGRANEEHPEASDRKAGESPSVAPTADEPAKDAASTPETPLTDTTEGTTNG